MNDLVSYLNSIYTDLRPSEIHGIGTFTFKKAPKGINLFPHWEGYTGFYKLDLTDDNLDKSIIPILEKYFSKKDNMMSIFLVQNVHFTSPWRHYVNNSINPNVSSNGITISTIKKDTEILRNYKDTSIVSNKITII
jgi:hypothetical protein